MQPNSQQTAEEKEIEFLKMRMKLTNEVIEKLLKIDENNINRLFHGKKIEELSLIELVDILNKF